MMEDEFIWQCLSVGLAVGGLGLIVWALFL